MIILIIIVVIISNVSPMIANNDKKDRFPGYGSGVTRVEPLNLTAIKQRALSKGFKVRESSQIALSTFDSPNFLDTGRFYMQYDLDVGFTFYSFDYGSNESGVLKKFYEKLGYYMNKSDAEIDEEIEYYEQDHKNDVTLGKAIEGEPLLRRLILDQGTITENRTNEIGQIYLKFDSGTSICIDTEFLVVSEKGGMLHMHMDKDSDIQLFIDSEKPLENPINLFTPFFDDLGIPSSILEQVHLQIPGLI